MKANAPEKIYIFEEDLQRKDHIVMYGINQDKDIRGLVEYIRSDTFIKKATLWLLTNASDYCILHNSYDTEELVKDFVDVMKRD